LEQIIVNGYIVNWSRAELCKGKLIRSIDAKHLAVLKLLAQASGNIVSQQQMLDSVWSQSVVSPNTIQQAITQLRKLLDDDGRNQKAIKTHPKLGYSLIFKAHKAILPAHAKSDIKSNNGDDIPLWNILLGLTLILLIVILLFIDTTESAQQQQIQKITPITVQGEIVQSVTLNNNSKELYYLVKNHLVSDENSQSLRKQHLYSANVETLAEDLNVYGTIALSPNNQHIAFSQISRNKKDKKKCVRLFTFNLKNNAIVPLLPCGKNFQHSPSWLNSNTLIYLATDKQNNNTLHQLNVDTLSHQQLKLGLNHIVSYDVVEEMLVAIANDTLSVFSLIPNNNTAKIAFSRSLSVNASKVRWLANDKLALINSDSVQTISLNGETSSFTLSGIQQVNDLFAIASDHYIAILGQQNWSVRERILANALDWDVGESDYRETKAKYNNQDNGVSYLSNRSGLQQVWHQNSSGLTQLTKVLSPVSDYLWAFDDTSLLFISDNKLWLQAKGLNAVNLTPAITPLRLYQSSKQHVLLSAKVNDKHALLWLNLETKQWHILQAKEVNWAQYINKQILMTNDATGKLEKYVNGDLTTITALPALTLQWRYFWRTDASGSSALYFQDKELNIWQFDPINDAAMIIGRYDINALFMTDYSASRNSMLSDNFVAEQQQLVHLKMY
jgi:DNA-binding winged helix-turn-helix (wHTH) protein